MDGFRQDYDPECLTRPREHHEFRISQYGDTDLHTLLMHGDPNARLLTILSKYNRTDDNSDPVHYVYVNPGNNLTRLAIHPDNTNRTNALLFVEDNSVYLRAGKRLPDYCSHREGNECRLKFAMFFSSGQVVTVNYLLGYIYNVIIPKPSYQDLANWTRLSLDFDVAFNGKTLPSLYLFPGDRTDSPPPDDYYDCTSLNTSAFDRPFDFQYKHLEVETSLLNTTAVAARGLCLHGDMFHNIVWFTFNYVQTYGKVFEHVARGDVNVEEIDVTTDALLANTDDSTMTFWLCPTPNRKNDTRLSHDVVPDIYEPLCLYHYKDSLKRVDFWNVTNGHAGNYVLVTMRPPPMPWFNRTHNYIPEIWPGTQRMLERFTLDRTLEYRTWDTAGDTYVRQRRAAVNVFFGYKYVLTGTLRFDLSRRATIRLHPRDEDSLSNNLVPDVANVNQFQLFVDEFPPMGTSYYRMDDDDPGKTVEFYGDRIEFNPGVVLPHNTAIRFRALSDRLGITDHLSENVQGVPVVIVFAIEVVDASDGRVLNPAPTTTTTTTTTTIKTATTTTAVATAPTTTTTAATTTDDMTKMVTYDTRAAAAAIPVASDSSNADADADDDDDLWILGVVLGVMGGTGIICVVLYKIVQTRFKRKALANGPINFDFTFDSVTTNDDPFFKRTGDIAFAIGEDGEEDAATPCLPSAPPPPTPPPPPPPSASSSSSSPTCC